MACRIHLIEKRNLFRPTDRSAGEYESGFWAISPKTAAALVGGDIYLHRKRTEPSFMGGQILSYRTESDGEYVGRIVFRFRAEPGRRGVPAGSDGWGREKKIVR